MSLITQLGPLDQLDLHSDETLQSILRSDKHQMLEGLIVEAYFQQFLGILSSHGAHKLPVALCKAVYKNHDQTWRNPAWWLWNQDSYNNDTDLLESKISADSNPIVSCTYETEANDFIMQRWNQNVVNQPAQAFMMKQRRMAGLTYSKPSDEVSDDTRYMQAFWGGLQSIYDHEQLFSEVILHRLFKNCVISPFFTALWDVDNIVRLPSGELAQFEVKHKYPFERDGKLFFGINRGQLGVMTDLARMGINTLHMVMVKPKWTDTLSPNYLLQNLDLRSHVLLLGYQLDSARLSELKYAAGGTSGNKTSLDGRRPLSFVSIPATSFHCIGSLDDSVANLASNISKAAKGELHNPVTDKQLYDARTA